MPANFQYMAGELIETFSNSEVRVIICFVNFWLIFLRDNQIALDFRAVFAKLSRIIIQILGTRKPVVTGLTGDTRKIY